VFPGSKSAAVISPGDATSILGTPSLSLPATVPATAPATTQPADRPAAHVVPTTQFSLEPQRP
jgi:hypothetical protein